MLVRLRALVTSLALAALAVGMTATAAQATAPSPVYFSCAKAPKGQGRFSNKTCSAVAPGHTGKYERVTAVGATYTTKTKTATLNTPGIGHVTCKKSASTGKVISDTEAEDSVTFSSCETTGIPCESVEPAGAKEGEIKTFLLKATLGQINSKEVGADVTGFEGEEHPSAFFHCGAEIFIKTTGGVIGKVTSPLNSAEKKGTELFAGNGTEQVPTKFEEGATSVLHTEIIGLGTFTSIEEVEASQKNNAAIGVVPTSECAFLRQGLAEAERELAKNPTSTFWAQEVSFMEGQVARVCGTAKVE